MKRKEEHAIFKENLCIIASDKSEKEKEQSKSKLFELLRMDRPLVLSIIRNGYFFKNDGEVIPNYRLIDIVNGNLFGYKLPDYLETIKLIKEHSY